MVFFTKKQKLYKIIKLYKTVDLVEGTLFNFKSVTFKCFDFINKIYEKYPEYFEVNYGVRHWRSFSGFSEAIEKMDNKDIVNLMSAYSKEQACLIINNDILNYKSPPKRASINVNIAISDLAFDYNIVENLLRTLYEDLNYDYGYIVELDENFDFITERKIGSTLFGTKVTISEVDTVWSSHSIGSKFGYIRNLYSCNLLNKMHFEHPGINKLIDEGIGKISILNGSIKVWFLSELEHKIALKELLKTNIMIANKDSYKNFLKTEDSKRINEDMRAS